MIDLKNSSEIQIMAEAGQIGALALKNVLAAIEPGITTLELDRIADKTMRDAGAEPGFHQVDDYKYATCVSVNDEVVHGLPTEYKLREGDIIGIDTGAFYKGFHSDVSESVIVGNADNYPVYKKFLEVGKRTLEEAITHAVIGNRIGHISNAIQTGVESAGYSVVRELIGHGVGRTLHEEPPVPGLGKPNSGITIQEGLVIAIEIIYNMGKRQVYLDRDGWTVKTVDGEMSGLFERTVAITKDGPKILTPI